jgi:hypothetical protein
LFTAAFVCNIGLHLSPNTYSSILQNLDCKHAPAAGNCASLLLFDLLHCFGLYHKLGFEYLQDCALHK